MIYQSIKLPICRVFLFSLCSFVLFSSFSVEAKFIDEDEFPAWAEDAIETVSDERIMTGYGDGRFAPDELLNRAQAVTLLLRIKEIEEEEETDVSEFEDVPAKAWFRKSIGSALKRGWVKGRGQGRFEPEATLTRAEWAAMVTRVFELVEDEIETDYEYYDVPAQVWFTPYVYSMAENGLIRFPNTNYYRPEKLITRAEAAWTMASILAKPRLMGTSTVNEFSAKVGLNHRKISVKPKDFNPNKQGYTIEKEELGITVVSSEGEVVLSTDPDFVYLGVLQVSNTFEEDPAELESLSLKLRFENSGVGPMEEFEVKLEGDGYSDTVTINRSGEALFTGMKLSLAPAEAMELSIEIRSKENARFFQKKGTGNFYVSEGGALVSRIFESTGRRGSRYAPVGITNRDIVTIIFDPTK